jgi:phosphoglucosamine mutase
MTRKFFGTDGIRGTTNSEPMTAETALRVGQAAGAHFLRGDHRHRVVIGKDTRLSGYMMESAMVAGFTSVGMDVVLLGPMPTPAVAMLTRSMRADLGVMISASHNPFADNGIKLFGPDGYKLSDDDERAIERRLEEKPKLAKSEMIGRARRIDDARGRYIHFAKDTFPGHLRLDGLKVVIDCANGAAYHVAPEALWELGAEVVPIGVSPNGLNINEECGSTKPQLLQETVVASGADIGIAVDGDADRVIICDENGEEVDGDTIMAMCARRMIERGELKHKTLVTTVMSNLGLERSLEKLGGRIERVQVGDRYVVESMRQNGYNFGGEQSGHLVFLDHMTTGDGVLGALQVLAVMLESGQPLSELKRVMTRYPQVLVNFKVKEKKPLDGLPDVAALIAKVEKMLGADGRVLVRYSGTEAKARVMVEGPDQAVIQGYADEIARALESACGAA